MLLRPLMINLKMTIRDDCAVSARWPLLSESVHKSSHSLLVGAGGSLPLDRHHPLQFLASEIKQTLLPTNLACLLGFEHRATIPTTLQYLSFSVWLIPVIIPSRSIHVVANGKFYSLLWSWVIFIVYIPYLLYPFIYWWTLSLILSIISWLL